MGVIEEERQENKTKDASEEEKDLEIGISSRHQALERILRDIKQMIGEKVASSEQEGVEEKESGHHQASPLDRAQELVYRAWEATGPERAQLAVEALETSEDCADAYVILAEETAETSAEAIQMYELAVRAGERALGPGPFRESVGEFWDMVESHPYMRARTKLAKALWEGGDHRRAIIHYKELLRLDSGDSQGIRYELMNCLLEEGLHQEVKDLIVEYRGDQTAAWLYSRALWAYVRFGAGMRAGSYLTEALKANKFVPGYLLGLKGLPKVLPDYHGWGDENEAILYAHGAQSTWNRVDGAIEWLDRYASSDSAVPGDR